MLFKILHGDSSRISLDTTPFHEGWAYVTHDGYFYIDLNTGTEEQPNNQRLKLNAGNCETLVGKTWEEIQAMIPTKVSDLENDAEYITADALSGLGGGDMLKATYDTDGDGVVDNAEKLGGVAASEYAKKTDVPTVPTNVGAFTNDVGYLTSYTETDPKFTASPAGGITTGDITNWNAKATTTYVDTKVAGIVDTAPEALDTLNELAAALGDDPNFATTVMTEIGKKVDKTTTVNGQALSGNVTITSVNHATTADSATVAVTATSAIQDNQGRNIVNTYATKTELNGKADSGYGFGESANVTVSDIDNLTKTGFYQFVTDEFDGSATNYYLIHQIHTDKYACQTAIKVINASVVYQRVKQGGTWGTWIRYITSGNIASQSVASATKATQDGIGRNIADTLDSKSSLKHDYLISAGDGSTHYYKLLTLTPTSSYIDSYYEFDVVARTNKYATIRVFLVTPNTKYISNAYVTYDGNMGNAISAYIYKDEANGVSRLEVWGTVGSWDTWCIFPKTYRYNSGLTLTWDCVEGSALPTDATETIIPTPHEAGRVRIPETAANTELPILCEEDGNIFTLAKDNIRINPATGTITTKHATGGEAVIKCAFGNDSYFSMWGNNSTGTRGMYDTTIGYVAQITDAGTTFYGNLNGNATTATAATSATKAAQDSNGNTISTYYMKRGIYERIEGTSSAHKNLNDYTTAGFYNVKTAHVDNCPSGIGIDAVLLVYQWDSSGYECQEITESAASTTARRWIRHKNGSTWTAWVEMVTSQNIGSQSVNYATSAGSASSVAWGNVSGKPSTFTPASHTHAASTIIGLAIVATSGKYSDLSGRPTIPAAANNGTLTIQKNGSTVATFGANSASNATANITVPTKTSELTNDSGFKNISYGTTLPSTGVNGQIFLLQG